MLHRGPQFPEDLSTRFDRLMGEYEQSKGKNVNADRQKLIKLIQSFGENKDQSYDHYAALGICVYGLIKIEGNCSLFMTPKQKSHYRLWGSELGDLVQKTLNIGSTNQLDDQQALRYLVALYHHIKTYPRRFDGTFGENKESEELTKEIEKYIKMLLEQLATKRPTYRALLQNFAELMNKYKELGGNDQKRHRYILFTQLLNSDLFERYQCEAKENREWTDAYTIRYAAMLFMMEEIEGEYHYFSPERSALYRACKQALNITNNTQQISQELKCNYYVALLSFVVRILSQPNEAEKWEKHGLTNPIQFFEKTRNALAEKVVDLMHVTNQDCVTLSYLDIVTSSAASYGVGIAVAKMATEMSLRGPALQYMTVLRPEVALLITLLAYATKTYVSQKATGAVKTVIIDTVTQPVMISFNTAMKFGGFCYNLFLANRCPKSAEVIDNADFMQALASLPDTLFTPALKEKMKYVVAYGRDDYSIENDMKPVKLSM